MKTLKRTRYYTMNSWNLSEAPAYNLKIYNVIDKELQDKVYEQMETGDFYFEINELLADFDHLFNYTWQAGFNGRSGGYLVLYQGGRHSDGRPFSYPGRGIEDKDVPVNVLREFRKLAIEIVKSVEYNARHFYVIDEEYTEVKTRKVLTTILK